MKEMLQTKKGNSAIHFVIIGFIVIIIVLAFVAIGVANQKGYFNQEEAPTQNLTRLFLRSQDGEEGKFIDANYILLGESNTILSRGNLKSSSFIEVTVPIQEKYTLMCWNDSSHYLVKIHKLVTPRDLSFNKTKITCWMPEIGELKIRKVSGGINNRLNKIKINLTAINGNVNSIAVCYKWSAGVIDVTTSNQWRKCQFGIWKNFTKYYPNNETYDYLPKGEYVCGVPGTIDEVVEVCTETEGNRCKLRDMKTPHQYYGKVDMCSYTGITLKDGESIELELTVETLSFMNQLDYLEMIFFDHDRRWNNQEDRTTWFSEFDGKDLGTKEVRLTIDYEK